MKKKRFIKLLMAEGIPRNTAAEAAKAIVITGVPRAVALANILGVRDYLISVSLTESAKEIDHSLFCASKAILLGGTAYE